LLCEKFFITEFQREKQERERRTSSGGHIKDRRNKRMVETSRRERKKEAFSEGDMGPERTVAP
jgi:hypothetical protein